MGKQKKLLCHKLKKQGVSQVHFYLVRQNKNLFLHSTNKTFHCKTLKATLVCYKETNAFICTQTHPVTAVSGNCILQECYYSNSINIKVEAIEKVIRLHSLYYKTVTRVTKSMCPYLICSYYDVLPHGQQHGSSHQLLLFHRQPLCNHAHCSLSHSFYIYTHASLNSHFTSQLPKQLCKCARATGFPAFFRVRVCSVLAVFQSSVVSSTL